MHPAAIQAVVYFQKNNFSCLFFSVESLFRTKSFHHHNIIIKYHQHLNCYDHPHQHKNHHQDHQNDQNHNHAHLRCWLVGYSQATAAALASGAVHLIIGVIILIVMIISGFVIFIFCMKIDHRWHSALLTLAQTITNSHENLPINDFDNIAGVPS